MLQPPEKIIPRLENIPQSRGGMAAIKAGDGTAAVTLSEAPVQNFLLGVASRRVWQLLFLFLLCINNRMEVE